MAWDNSNRRARLPSNWKKLRARVLRRDDHTCTYPRCHHHDPTARTLEVDHIVPGDDHSFSNLQTLCVDCHTRKTLEERRQPRNRPAERHPGLTG